MLFGTYQCEDCGDTQDITKKYGEDWPDSVECPFCKTKTAKKIIGVAQINFPPGKSGNAANNYTSVNNRKGR